MVFGKDQSTVWIGKHHSERTKKKQSLAHKGQIPVNYIDGKWNKRKRLSSKKIHKIWCEENHFHRVPDAMIIHHIDFDPKNNNPNNLLMLPRDFHSKMHNNLIMQGGN